eukprot:3288336-Amphidinium_carterae.1
MQVNNAQCWHNGVGHRLPLVARWTCRLQQSCSVWLTAPNSCVGSAVWWWSGGSARAVATSFAGLLAASACVGPAGSRICRIHWLHLHIVARLSAVLGLYFIVCAIALGTQVGSGGGVACGGG